MHNFKNQRTSLRTLFSLLTSALVSTWVAPASCTLSLSRANLGQCTIICTAFSSACPHAHVGAINPDTLTLLRKHTRPIHPVLIYIITELFAFCSPVWSFEAFFPGAPISS